MFWAIRSFIWSLVDLKARNLNIEIRRFEKVNVKGENNTFSLFRNHRKNPRYDRTSSISLAWKKMINYFT